MGWKPGRPSGVPVSCLSVVRPGRGRARASASPGSVLGTRWEGVGWEALNELQERRQGTLAWLSPLPI